MTAPPLKITRAVLTETMIARDPRNPKRSAVYYVPPEGGPHVLLAVDLRDRAAAERWIEERRKECAT